MNGVLLLLVLLSTVVYAVARPKPLLRGFEIAGEAASCEDGADGADRGDADLDGGEKGAGPLGEAQRPRGAAVPRSGLGLQAGREDTTPSSDPEKKPLMISSSTRMPN